MAINQLIAAGIQPPRFESPYNMMAQFAQIQQAQQANALNQMRMQQMEREMAQEEALRGLDYAALAQSPEMALRYGAPGRALFGEVLKGQRELRQAKLAEAQALPELIKGLRFSLAPVNSQESYDAWRNTAAKTIPALADSLPKTFSQDTKLSLSLEADKLYERVIKELGLGGTKEVLAVPKYGEGAPTTLATRVVTPEPRTPEQIALDQARAAGAQYEIVDTPEGRVRINLATGIGTPVTMTGAAPGAPGATPSGQVPSAPGVPTELSRLLREQSKHQPGTPAYDAYQKAIENYKKGMTIETPVPVVDPQTGVVTYATRQEALGKTPPQFMEGLTPRERQNREAKLPAARAAISAFESKADKLASQIEELLKHPGLNQITGLLGGRIVGITDAGRRAEALYKSIVAQGGFSELQAMRDASTTGGALGNVSNQEGQYLRDAFGVLQRTQSTEDLQRGLRDALNTLRSAKTRTREAFDDTYAYREGATPSAAPASRGAVGGGDSGGVDRSNPLLK